MRRLSSSLLALTLGLPHIAFATTALDEVVLNASLTPVAAGRTGATVSVVTPDALRKAGEARALSQLEQVAGVNIRTNGSFGTVSGFSLRGASQSYVKVTVDGIDFSDPAAPQVAAYLGSLSTGPLERIEVVKGSQTALQGAGAIGGLIAITTPRADAEGTEQRFDLEFGRYGTRAGTYALAHRQDETEVSLLLSHLTTDGFSTAAGQPEADGSTTSRGHLHLSQGFDNGLRVGLSGFVMRERGEFDPQFYYDLAPGSRVPVRNDPWGLSIDAPSVTLGDGVTHDEVTNNRLSGLRLYAEGQAYGLTHNFALSRFNIRRASSESELALDYSSYDPVTGTGVVQLSPVDTLYNGRRETVTYQASGAVTASLQTTFGLDWARETYRQSGTWGGGTGTISSRGVFAEGLWAAAPQVDLSLALRHEDHSDFGGAQSGRVAGVYRWNDQTLFRAQGGIGYRAPSSYERFAPFYGNLNLMPEDSRSFDLGVEHHFASGASLRATAFWLEVDNLIDYSNVTNSYAQVAGTSRRTGIEIETEAAISDRLTIGGSYSYIDSAASVAAGWQAAPPRHTVHLSLGAEMTERLSLGASVRGLADRSQGLGNVTTLNLSAAYALSDQASVYLRVENALDADYQMVPGYQTSGQALYVGLKTRF